MYSLSHEVAEAKFGDKRLTKRLVTTITRMGNQPNLSLPAAMHSRAELEGCYRLFDHKRVTHQGILKPHHYRTTERVLDESICLLVQDTTEVEFKRPNQQVEGAGVLSCHSRLGVYVHPLQALTKDGRNLGTVWYTAWTRESIDTQRSEQEKSKELAKKPIEEKESFRWLQGQREARKVAEMCPDTQCVLVCDSEADIYEVFSEDRQTSHGRSLELLIRGCQDRATHEADKSLLDTVRATDVISSMVLEVGGRRAKTKMETDRRGKSRQARTAQVEVRAGTVTLRPPRRPDRELPPVTVNVVLVEEVSPPDGEEPISWMLLTTLPIATPEQVFTIVDYYCRRWSIEIYFKILKTGCRIEERQFETLDRQMNSIAIYMIVAWRIQLLTHLGRECPEMDCSIVFEESEWKAVYIVATGQQPPDQPPTLNTMIRLIASLGGYVPRQNTEPGPQTLWIGMQRMRDLACGYEAFGPGSNASKRYVGR